MNNNYATDKAIDFNTFANAHRFALGNEIFRRKKIYLDTNYWAELRNIFLGRDEKPGFEKLLDSLHDGVKNSQIICPITDETFLEITKQNDPVTFFATVDLIDRLSCGVSLLSSQERIKYEIISFLRENSCESQAIHPGQISIWTKVGTVLGLQIPCFPLLKKEQENELQKLYFEKIWSISLREMVEQIGLQTLNEMPRPRNIAEHLNSEKVEHMDEHNSFKQLFMAEVGGALEVYVDVFEEGLVYLYEKEFGYKPTQEELDKSSSGQIFANIIYNLYNKNKARGLLPTLVIEAALHAAVRNDVQRKYKPNDLADFRHARAALPYYDYLFTEGPLCTLLNQKNIKFKDSYACFVCNDVSQANENIERLIR